MATNAAAVIWPEILKQTINALQAGTNSGFEKFALKILAAVFITGDIFVSDAKGHDRCLSRNRIRAP